MVQHAKASKLIAELQAIVARHGDLSIIGGYVMDDTPLRKVTLIDGRGYDVIDGGGKATSIFLES